MYFRLITTTITGLLTSRFVLSALGARDFGLYAVVGGLVVMLSVISMGLHSTTRRYVNVEMGKPQGNVNRIFNVALMLHLAFGILVLILAETAGLFYIYNFLNVDADRFNDAIFIFHISALSSAVGIANVPFQALIEAKEKFRQVAIIDIISSLVKLAFCYSLAFCTGNLLRIYTTGIGVVILLQLILYYIFCRIQWKELIQFKIYHGWNNYREMLIFNNYVALGAISYFGRSQGSTLLVNFFFGTVTNAAFAIAYAIENYCIIFVNNIGSAISPQVTQNYSEKQERSVQLTMQFSKYSIYLMLLLFIPLIAELNYVLNLWLKSTPPGALLLCQLTLISALVRVLCGGTTSIIQASGRIKWFIIVSCTLELMCLPVSFILFRNGYPAWTIIIIFTLFSVFNRVYELCMMRRILNFPVGMYIRQVYTPSFIIIAVLIGCLYIYSLTERTTNWSHLSGMVLLFLVTFSVIYIIGFNHNERLQLKRIIRKYA